LLQSNSEEIEQISFVQHPDGASKAGRPSLARIPVAVTSKVSCLDWRPVFGNAAFWELVLPKAVMCLNGGLEVQRYNALCQDSIGHPCSGVGQDSRADVTAGLQKSEPPVEVCKREIPTDDGS
jgi:hypothetical protein